MLLTKPLSNFLNANRSPHIHTLFLATPTGKLLSSSSSTPAALLRNQATIASSIWELYGPLTAAGTIGAALPSSSPSSDDSSPTSNSPPSDDEDGDGHGNAPHHHSSDPAVSSIVIQLETGVMVIRALRCSLLFVIVGPAPSSPPASSSSTRGLTQGMSFLSVQSATTAAASSSSSPPASSHSQTNGDGVPAAERRLGGSSSASLSGTGTGSGGSAPVGPSLKVFKRLAEELAKCLDVELEGFTLSTGL